MTSHLVFISGASSGIGAALARGVPWPDARIVNISRRALDGFAHFRADLSDPQAWVEVAELFAREMKGFAGERVVFIHSAGTLEPIGFAAEVPAEAYARQVLLNSASPQVLGAAFVRSAGTTASRCQMLIIGSGAAANIYPGWSAYGAGKAAVNQWVRTVGSETRSRGSDCCVVSIAPGIVATPMQDRIRTTSQRAFPDRDDFVGYFERGELRDPDAVAAELWRLLQDDELDSGAVLDLRDREG